MQVAVAAARSAPGERSGRHARRRRAPRRRIAGGRGPWRQSQHDPHRARRQLAEVQQEKALNKCLAASPHKNTPCTLREALKLANLATRLIASITATLDGTEKACVRAAALNEIAYLKVWRQAMFLLRANHRLQARRLIIRSGPLLDSLTKTEKTCFAEALVGSP